MEIFADYAGDKEQPLNNVYGPAAQLVDVSCGPRFVRAEVVGSSGAGRIGQTGWGWVVAVMGVVWMGGLF